MAGAIASQLATFSMAVAFTVLLIRALRSSAPVLGLVDSPNWRKRHVGAVPLVGGLAMFLAVALVLGTGPIRELPLGLCAGATLVVLLGLVDDRASVAPPHRLLIEAIAVFAATAATGTVLDDVGHLLGPRVLELGYLAAPFTIFGVVGVMNAFNLTDGLDGLAAGIALTVVVALGAVFIYIPVPALYQIGASGTAYLLVAIGGALLGFLMFNMRTPWRLRASVFMGDAGSLFLGFIIGWTLVLVCSLAPEHRLTPVSALWMLIVPVFDTATCMIRRKLRGRSPMRADASHIHHLLQARGLSIRATVAVLIAANGVGCAVGFFGWRLGLPESAMLLALVSCFVLYFALIQRSWTQISSRYRPGLVLVRPYVHANTPAYRHGNG